MTEEGLWKNWPVQFSLRALIGRLSRFEAITRPITGVEMCLLHGKAAGLRVSSDVDEARILALECSALPGLRAICMGSSGGQAK